MTSRQFRLRPYFGTMALAMLCAVTACKKSPQAAETQNVVGTGAPAMGAPIAALPLTTATPPPAPLAPAAAALPRAHRMVSYSELSPGERYRYVDDAYAMGNAFGDTPPDYTVDYEGTEPWVWRAANGAYRVIEYTPEGSRDYYYAPGADEPFLVRDPGYAYAYRRGALVGIYDSNGRMLADTLAARRAEEASRYLYRAQALYRAATQEQRRAAYAASWEARRDAIRAQQQHWAEAQARDADWRAWRDAHRDNERREWQREQSQRLAYATAVTAALHAHRDRGSDSDRPRDADRGFWGSDNRPMAAQREADNRAARQATEARHDADIRHRQDLDRQAARLAERHDAADRAMVAQRQHDADQARHRTDIAEHARQAAVERAAHHAEQMARREAEHHHHAEVAAQTRHDAVERAAHHAQEVAQAQHARQETRKAAEQARHHAEAEAHIRAVQAAQANHQREQAAHEQQRREAARAREAANRPHDHPQGQKHGDEHHDKG